jgi:acetyltransferase-like isoleucine patch superfamily enzyme
LGIGSIIIDCLNIRYSSIIGAGSLVLKDTEANTLSVGAPAKIIKYLNN